MMFFSLNKVKNGPKRPYNVPKRAKNALKKAKNRVFGPKKKVFFLSGIGGTPPQWAKIANFGSSRHP